MKKILIFLVMLVFVLAACKESPEIPEKTYDTVEFMYQRVKPIIHPEWNDPSCFMIWRNNGGGMNLRLTLTGHDEWRAEGTLDYTSSQNPYYIWVDDQKVKEWAEDIFARIKGQQEWIKLTLIKPNGNHPLGEWAVFCLDKNGIYFPE